MYMCGARFGSPQLLDSRLRYFWPRDLSILFKKTTSIMAAPSMATSLGSGNRDCDVDKVTFVEEPLDTNHECLVCLQLLREPWIVECCGHHLCKPCIDKLVRDRQGCPHCRTPRFRHMRDRNHERILLGKQVYCKYRNKGCEWQGTLREVDQHPDASKCWCF